MSNPVGDQWYYAQGTEQRGPVDAAALRQMLASGALRREDLVWRDGMGNWEPIGNIPELQGTAAYPPMAPTPQQQAPYPPAYGVPPAPGVPLGYSGEVDTSGKANTAMILGILSLVLWLCPIVGLAVGIPAWVMGQKYKNGRDGSKANAGMIMGIIGCALSVLNACAGVIIRLST